VERRRRRRKGAGCLTRKVADMRIGLMFVEVLVLRGWYTRKEERQGSIEH